MGWIGALAQALATVVLSSLLATPAAAQLCGDLNTDGVVDAFDATILREHHADLQRLSSEQALLCNVIDEVTTGATTDPSDLASHCSSADSVVITREGAGLAPGVAPLCPMAAAGNCCSLGGGAPGCDDPVTVACVCAVQPSCCTTGWDPSCAELACTGACAFECRSPDPTGANVLDLCFDGSCCPAGPVQITGTAGNDNLAGTAAAECIVALEGADQVDALAGDDYVLAGPGDDVVSGDEDDDALLGGADDDQLDGAAGCDLVTGGGGDDVLRGGPDADTIVPGSGTDLAFGDEGADLFVIRSRCEIQGTERIDGGSGVDTVRSPFTQLQLAALGVVTTSVEVFDTKAPDPGLPDGACWSDGTTGVVCDCCDHGFDPATLCTDCLPGLHPVVDNDLLGDVDDARGVQVVCKPDLSCLDLDCGSHGSCVESGDEAFCQCDCGYAGALCDECAPPFEPDGQGGCYLGPECGDHVCSGNGTCRADEACEVDCVCDDGWDGSEDCEGPRVRIGGPEGAVPGGGTFVYEYGVGTRHGATCTGDFNWSVLQGDGVVIVDPVNSQHAQLLLSGTPMSEDVEMTVLRAECSNDSNVAADYNQTLVRPPSDPQAAIQFIEGVGDPRLEPFDDAMVDYLDDQKMLGGTLAVTYQEQLVYLRAYGVRSDPVLLPELPMRTCTPMRVASVTKPFTEAAIQSALYGTTIPPQFGGGTVGQNTPLTHDGMGGDGILSASMQLTGTLVDWQGPGTLYVPSFPNNNCSVINGVPDGLIHAPWSSVRFGNLLSHTSGVQPNGSYLNPATCNLANNGCRCTGAAGEVCMSLQNVGDPMVSGTRLTTMANDLGLDHGVVDVDDILHWMAGICMYDTPANGNFRYSNFGYAVAGRALEILSGQSWEDFVLAFLEAQDVLGPSVPGNGFAYQGQNAGDGPATGTVPAHLEESHYTSAVPSNTDVTQAELDNGSWVFNETAVAPYGVLNMDVMYGHGSLVVNVEALSDFMHEFRIDNGCPRDPLAPVQPPCNTGAGYNTYSGGQAFRGMIWGSDALVLELNTTQPQNPTNPNGPGCLVPENISNDPNDPIPLAINRLDVTPCRLPPGIRIAVIFNRENLLPSAPGYVGGLHDPALQMHRLRLAASQVGDASVWGSLGPLRETDDRRVGCDLKCGQDTPFCVPLTCGDGNLDADEECDDGNNTTGDGCDGDCTLPGAPDPFAACVDEPPGECLGGPCALIMGKSDTLPIPSASDILDFRSAAHPDGDHHPDQFCWDNAADSDFPWPEATCVRETHDGGKIGICKECTGTDMTGCECPVDPLIDPDGGCPVGLTCIGGRCYPQFPDLQPGWMCTSVCADIYGANSGHCLHDSVTGRAVCYPFLCDEPPFPHPYCDYNVGQQFEPPVLDIPEGAVCDPAILGCEKNLCCDAECLVDADCDALGHVGHFCSLGNRCVIQAP